MKKRLCKKRHLGEFTEFGFSLRFAISEDLSVTARDSLLDEFIAEIERLGLQFGGGGILEWDGFVALNGRGSVTERHREAMLGWLESNPNVVKPEAGSLVDAWH